MKYFYAAIADKGSHDWFNLRPIEKYQKLSIIPSFSIEIKMCVCDCNDSWNL